MSQINKSIQEIEDSFLNKAALLIQEINDEKVLSHGEKIRLKYKIKKLFNNF